MAIKYTTAPKDYDYSYVVELETFEFSSYGHITRTWRKIDIQTDEYRVNYQCGRYQSGMHPVLDTDPRLDF